MRLKSATTILESVRSSEGSESRTIQAEPNLAGRNSSAERLYDTPGDRQVKPIWSRTATSLQLRVLRFGFLDGDVEVSDLSDYDPDAERLANEHEAKMRKFVSEWHNTAPDEHAGHIRKHQWMKD